MLRFLTMRILGAIPLLFLLSIVTFAIIQAPPGDYGDYIRAMAVNQGGATPEQAEIQAELYRQANGLNDPMIVQYFRWITGIVTRFDFGHSFYYNKDVGQVVAERLAMIDGQLPSGITPNITPLTSSASTVLGVGLTSKTRSLMEGAGPSTTWPTSPRRTVRPSR